MAVPTHLIVGLGNPGEEYANTRHNIGFMAVDAIADDCKAGAWKKKFKGLITQASLDDADLLFLKPQTYMNLSGESVAEAMRFHKLAPKDVIVFHDELDLEPAQVKVKQGGGNAGHNGLKSIDAHMGVNYWRVRLGIGHPGQKAAVSNHVLDTFSKADAKWVKPLLDALTSEFGVMLGSKKSEYAAHVKKRLTED